MSELNNKIIVIAVLGLGTALVLPGLGKQSLWLDEILTVMPVLRAGSLAELIAMIPIYDAQPPASHALLYGLQTILPRTEFFLRLPSFVAIELGLILSYLTVARLWSQSHF